MGIEGRGGPLLHNFFAACDVNGVSQHHHRQHQPVPELPGKAVQRIFNNVRADVRQQHRRRPPQAQEGKNRTAHQPGVGWTTALLEAPNDRLCDGPHDKHLAQPLREQRPASAGACLNLFRERRTSRARPIDGFVPFQTPTELADGLGVESLPRPNRSIRPCRSRHIQSRPTSQGTGLALGSPRHRTAAGGLGMRNHKSARNLLSMHRNVAVCVS
jgi:hypothetical protein